MPIVRIKYLKINDFYRNKPEAGPFFPCSRRAAVKETKETDHEEIHRHPELGARHRHHCTGTGAR
jgi:hypothetical protein